MSIRAYVLLDIVDGSSKYVLRTLQAKAGIILAAPLVGYNDIVAVIEASDRQGLIELLVPVINFVDGRAEDLQLLIQDTELPTNHSALRRSRQYLQASNAGSNPAGDCPTSFRSGEWRRQHGQLPNDN